MCAAVASSSGQYICPVCSVVYHSGEELQVHVNVDHLDAPDPVPAGHVGDVHTDPRTGVKTIVTVIKKRQSPEKHTDPNNNTEACPVCGVQQPTSTLEEHVNSHFTDNDAVEPAATVYTDEQYARKVEAAERRAREKSSQQRDMTAAEVRAAERAREETARRDEVLARKLQEEEEGLQAAAVVAARPTDTDTVAKGVKTVVIKKRKSPVKHTDPNNNNTKAKKLPTQEDVGDWVEHTDPASGRCYYYNHRTKVSQWDKPGALLVQEGVSGTRLIEDGTFQRIILKEKRSMTEDPMDVHLRLAESQYYRLQAKQAGRNTQLKLDYVEYIYNPTLTQRFTQQQKAFEGGYTSEEEQNYILAFHGTPQENIDNIARNNFSLDRAVRKAYGPGIYFSEFPDVSIDYAGGSMCLLLCKILPGRCETFPPKGKKYDSVKVTQNKTDDLGRGWAVIIHDNMDQILPYLILHLKK